MHGYVAVTHHRWFQHLAQRRLWDEVNFWRPSAHHSFNGPPGSPFFFKLKAPHNAQAMIVRSAALGSPTEDQ